MFGTRRTVALAGALLALATALPVLAMTGSTDGPAAVSEPAERVAGSNDVVSVYNVGALRSDVITAARRVAESAGGAAEIGRSASIGMQRVRRGNAMVQQAPSGAAFPMATTMLPTRLVSVLMGPDIARELSSNTLVMGARTAGLRGAQAGDVVDLVASSGAVVQFTIAAVAPDEAVGGTELLMSIEGADRLGVSRLSRVVLHGFRSRGELDQALAANGLISTSIRVRRSWDPFDPDFTIGMARTKEALGEFAYRVLPSGGVLIEDAWRSANITSGSIGRLTLRSGCHRTVRVALQNAMSEVIAAGLEFTINYNDANTAGGCYVPRFNRLTPNSSVGFLSRHTWGMAVDTNTRGSCQGCAPPDMDCRTVRIFRKHGFAWGGNFLRPDGMHFEWVGEPRHQGIYPSRYCQNIEPATAAALGDETQRSTLFAEDGLRQFEGDNH